MSKVNFNLPCMEKETSMDIFARDTGATSSSILDNRASASVVSLAPSSIDLPFKRPKMEPSFLSFPALVFNFCFFHQLSMLT